MKESTRVRERLGGGYAGIHSVEVAGEILLKLASFKQPTSLKALSEVCRLTPSKVHRYLSSMAKLGLVHHGKKSGNYSLGRNAILIGLAAMQQNDQLDEVVDALPELVDKIKCHVMLTVWSKAGPTIIKWVRSTDPLVVGLPLGQVMPMTRSACGLVFSAFLEPDMTRGLIEKELLGHEQNSGRANEDFESIVTSVRARRFAHFRGEDESDFASIAVPVLDWEDNPVVVISAKFSKHTDESRVTEILAALAAFSKQASVDKPTFPFES